MIISNKILQEQVERVEQGLAKVQQNGRALRYVEEQTPEICAEAVKNNPHAWKFVAEDLKEEVESLLDNENSLEEMMKEAKEINARQAQSVVDKESELNSKMEI